MMRSRIRKRWRWRHLQKLQWKLMRSYMVVTVSSVLIIYLLLGATLAYTLCRPSLSPQQLVTSANGIAAQLSRPLSASPDKAALVRILTPLVSNRMSAAVTDPSGKVLACVPEWFVKGDTSLFSQTAPEVKTLARVALTRNVSESHLSAKDADGNLLAVVAVPGTNRQSAGLLFLRITAPINLRDFSLTWIVILLGSVLVVGFFATIVGLGFGFLNARHLTRRLKAIADAADAWSRGEFSTVATDDEEDELGQLARRLNLMADELQELVVLRQNLAASEERNRLSRELHDTVKQQVFATTMQVGAARVLLDRDTEMARACLIESERLASEAQHELTALLEQLRPGSYLPLRKLDGSLESLLNAYVQDWSRPNGIVAEVNIKPIPNLAQTTRQALFRITQEALANVARHSRATKVQVQLQPALPNASSLQEGTKQNALSGQRVTLIIQDNGRGFDPLDIAGGFGFQSMRERAEALPLGTLHVESRLDHGTRIEVACSNRNAVDSDGT